MPDSRIKISYHYNSRKYSQEVIGHVFRYISALTGSIFYPDEQAPAISNIENVNNKLFINTVNDAIAEIASRLTLSIKIGPYSNDRHKPFNGPLLSEIVSGFVDDLHEAGLIPKQKSTISLWPSTRRFGLVVTHDVDIIRRTVLGGLRFGLTATFPEVGAP